MATMCAVFSFEEPESDITLAVIISTLKEQFQDLVDVKSYLANGRASRYILELLQTGLETRSPHVEHAKRELALTGNDADFNESIVKALSGIFSYGHSGGSAPVALELFTRLFHMENLTPLTDNPREWNLVGPGMYQSSRNSEAFSIDGGKTYYLLSEGASEKNPEPRHPSEHFEPPEEEEGNG